MTRGLGEFEQLILFALLRLGEGVSGVSVRQEIEARAGRSVSAGAVYTALERLEVRGFVSSRFGEPTPKRGGKRQKLYTLRPAGARALHRTHQAISNMARGRIGKLGKLAKEP